MDALKFQVLGPMRGLRGTWELPLGSPQQQAMLAVLLLRPGRSAGADELIDGLWGDRPPARARAVLRTYAWRLRQVMERPGADTSVLLSVAGGYRLDLHSGTALDGALDADAAAELARRAEQEAAGDPRRAREQLRQALELWRGEPLAAVPGPFADRQRQRFAELRLSLLERRIGLDIELGQEDGCIPELTSLTAEHPLRERMHGLLIRALAQAGRQGEALARYQEVRRLLVEELGVEPGPELAAVHAAVLGGGEPRLADPALAATAPVAAGAAAPAGPTPAGPTPAAHSPGTSATASGPTARPSWVPAQLPPREPDFVGREALVASLGTALARPPRSAPAVLALAGMGGAGKTALTLHVAHGARQAFPDGQLYVDLRGNSGAPVAAEGVLGDFLAALGLAPDEVPDGTAARSALFRSVADGRRLLIVLDNAADAEQVRPLLPGSDGCAAIVTSRTRLAGLPATVQHHVGVFEPDEARQLLTLVVGPERVRAEPEAAGELVRATGCLPLAVRIVAARLAARPGWSLRAMVDRLADERLRIDELRIGELAVAAAFELGYRQLTQDQAEAFRLLGALDAAEIGLGSAAALLGRPEQEAEALLESLVDVAMLESPAYSRYRHHDLLRDFARHLCAHTVPAEEAAARGRLLDFLLATACAAFEQAVPGDPIRSVLGPLHEAGPVFASPAQARAWVLAEAPGAVELAARIAHEAATGPTGSVGSAAPTDSASSAAADHLAMLGRAVNLLIALTPFGHGGRRGRLAGALDDMAAVAERHGHPRTRARACFLAGNLALAAGRFAEAEPRTRQAVDLCRGTDDPVILRQALNDLGVIAHAQGRHAEAVRHFREAVELARTLGHRDGETTSTLNAAAAQIRIGEADTVVEQCRKLLSHLRRSEDSAGAAQTLFVLGLAQAAQGHPLDAAGHFEAAADQWTALDLPGRAAHARLQLAQTLLAGGAADRACGQAEAALVEFERAGGAAELDRARDVLARARAAAASPGH